jgi:hypothetical protein
LSALKHGVYPDLHRQSFLGRRPERRKQLTVCIAAISHDHIVTVSDTMVSCGLTSADGVTIKSEPFHKDWMAMFAADDLRQCVPIIDKATKYFMGNRANTLSVARSVFKRAFQQHVVEMREDAVLSSYGLTMETFKKSGKRIFTEKVFESVCKRMDAVVPGCHFLVHGFDGKGKPHIFEVDGNGVDGVLDKPGFHAIGSGSTSAQGLLYFLSQSVVRPLHETIYNCVAAKFMAEGSDGVGRHTYLFVRKPGSTFFSHRGDMINDLRRQWDINGCPRVVPEAIDKIMNSEITIR